MWTWKGENGGRWGWKSKPDRNSISSANLFENSTLEHVWDVMTALWLYVICGWIELRFCTKKASWAILHEIGWIYDISGNPKSATQKRLPKNQQNIPYKVGFFLTKLKILGKKEARLMSTPSVWVCQWNENSQTRSFTVGLFPKTKQCSRLIEKPKSPFFFEVRLYLLMVY